MPKQCLELHALMTTVGTTGTGLEVNGPPPLTRLLLREQDYDLRRHGYIHPAPIAEAFSQPPRPTPF